MRVLARRIVAASVVGVCCVAWSESARADVVYDLTALGLTDAEHRRADGYCQSTWIDYNDKGGVTGRSSRWSGNTWMGFSAWFYENKTISRIGLWDAAHTRSDGFQSSEPLSITDRQQVLGNSMQYVGTYEGRTAWVYSKGVTKIIGLTDAFHTASSGMQYSYGFQQNLSGQAIGYSHQYKLDAYIGRDAWIYSGGETIRIGRTGSDAYRNGASWNEPEYISDGGYVAGWGGRYGAAGTYLGHTAWRYGNGQTLDIGLFDSAHTATDGTREGRTMGVNNSGDVIGYSSRYSGLSPTGETAWIYRGGATYTLGLTTGIHVSSSGDSVSEPTKINSSGQAAGWSTQYVGSAEGASTWFYDGSTTQCIGLTDAWHTKSDGTGYSIVVALNDAGTVAGVSEQRLTDGLSAFHYRDGATTRIGLLDSPHVRSDGWSANTITLLNASGQIAGVATRTNGFTGATAWFYDPAEEHTYPLEFSVSSSGLSSSVVQYLADDGVCLGTYSLFSGDSNLGNHAFYWSEEEGFHDLGSIEAGGLGAQGWQRLYDGIVINGNGDVILRGQLGGGNASATLFSDVSQFVDAASGPALWGDMPVMITAVPEPSSLFLFSGLATLLCLRSRKTPS